ncbi:MAG: radical SAM protein, partial [Candidatus Brocadiae bacterium]|nr:radical SAM protein [Candidatus Brocadiia bacterium]
GLLVRHLVMPNEVAGSKEILRFIAEEISPETYVNVMGQYRPMYEAHDYVEIARPPTRQEFDDVYLHARELALNLL